MEKVQVSYLLQGTVNLDVPNQSVQTIEEMLTKKTASDLLLKGVPDPEGFIDPNHIIMSSAQLVGSEEGTIYSTIGGQEITDVAAVAAINTHRAFSVWRKLTQSLLEVIKGERDIETAFDDIPIRDCLPKHTILATTWSIDDLRDHVPFGTSDEELYDHLLGIMNSLGNVATSSGQEVISDSFDGEVDNVVTLIDAWSYKDEEGIYDDVYSDENEAIREHGAENIVKGFLITGGSSIRPFIEKHFSNFYEHIQELMTDILKHPGMTLHVTDLIKSVDEKPSYERILVNCGTMVIGEQVFTARHCTSCHKDFVLESNNDMGKDGPRVYEFADICDECLSQGEI